MQKISAINRTLLPGKGKFILLIFSTTTNELTLGHILSLVWETWFQWLIDFKGNDFAPDENLSLCCLFLFPPPTPQLRLAVMTSMLNNSNVMNDQPSEKTLGFASGLKTFTIQRDSTQLLLTPGRSRRDLPTGKAPLLSLFLKGKAHGKLGPVLWPLQPLPAFNSKESLYPGMEMQLIFAEQQPAII